jgi:hypothetical protein
MGRIGGMDGAVSFSRVAPRDSRQGGRGRVSGLGFPANAVFVLAA